MAVLPATAGQTRIAFSYPPEGSYVQLTLDGRQPVIDEVQVDAKHITSRDYLYGSRS